MNINEAEKAKAEMKKAAKDLQDFVFNGGAKSERWKYMRALTAKQWELYEITNNINDMPRGAKSEF